MNRPTHETDGQIDTVDGFGQRIEIISHTWAQVEEVDRPDGVRPMNGIVRRIMIIYDRWIELDGQTIKSIKIWR